MPALMPHDPDTLADAVVTTLAVDADPQAREASIFYWERGLPYRKAVVEAMARVPDGELRAAAEALRNRPADPATHAALHRRLTELAHDRAAPALDKLFTEAWQAESNSRLGYHLGGRYSPRATPSVTPERLHSLAAATVPRPAASAEPGGDAETLVVVPFRDRGPGHRLRNLLACLLSLRDQSVPASSYRVVVVESDDIPRRRDAVLPYTDHYLFARKDGLFNKSWAVNVGVVNAPGRPEAVCILDADVLVDRDFIARNTARFRERGTMGHLSYRDMWCLGESATSWAIEERLGRGAPRSTPTTCGPSCSAGRPAAASGSAPAPSTASAAWTSGSRAGEARTTTSPTAWTHIPPSTSTAIRCCTCTTPPPPYCARTEN